eukprot:3717446-Alexandrium_andersonii.AAC.1
MQFAFRRYGLCVAACEDHVLGKRALRHIVPIPQWARRSCVGAGCFSTCWQMRRTWNASGHDATPSG